MLGIDPAQVSEGGITGFGSSAMTRIYGDLRGHVTDFDHVGAITCSLPDR